MAKSAASPTQRAMGRIALALAAAVAAGCANGDSLLDHAVVVFETSPPTWFESHPDRAVVVASGAQLVYGGSLGYVRTPITAQPTDAPATGGDPVVVDQGPRAVAMLVAGPSGQAAAVLREDSVGWRTLGDDGRLGNPLDLDAGIHPTWSADAASVAYRDPDSASVLVVGGARAGRIDLGRPIADYAWRGGAPELVVLTDEGEGSAALTLVDLEGGARPVVAALDGVPRAPGLGLAVTTDGRRAVVSAVGAGVPDPLARHDPRADRDLDLHQVDLESGRITRLGGSDGDDIAPQMVGDTLYWTSTTASTWIVAVPIEGGEPVPIVEGGQDPSWRPDGRAIGFFYGGFRAADWALNLDGGSVEVTADMAPAPDITPVAFGFHEDFAPVWSPDGAWIAYHSHRSPTPVASYGAPGSTDDIWIRGVDEPITAERRLTDWGSEVGSPRWAPDSARLLFTSQDPDRPGYDRPWIVTIDPRTGEALGRDSVALPRGVERVFAAAWSDDGERMALEVDEADSLHAVWVLDSRGAGRVTAYVMDTYGGVDWHPDGTRLILAARHEGDMRLFSIPTGGGAAEPLTPAGQHVFRPVVSPDGAWIAATRIRTLKQVWRATLES